MESVKSGMTELALHFFDQHKDSLQLGTCHCPLSVVSNHVFRFQHRIKGCSEFRGM